LHTSTFDSVLVFQTQGEQQPCHDVTHIKSTYHTPRAPVADCRSA